MAKVSCKFITQRAKDAGESLNSEFAHTVTAEMVTSSRDDDYGNKHYLIIEEESGYEYSLDARYDTRFNTDEKFYKNIASVLKDRYNMALYRIKRRK